jgi:hypothetical protein
MKWAIRILVAAVIFGLGFWAWRVFFPSPERVIRARLQALSQVVSFPANEAPLAKLANSQKLSAYFTPEVEISVDVRGHSLQTFSGRDELLQAALGARSAVASLTVEFVDVNVVLGPDGKSAVATLTAKGNVSGEKDNLIQELKFSLQKIERSWLINRVETVKTLL